MKLLLDTHILLWTLNGDPFLPKKAREMIADKDNDIYYSPISLWEIEIKHIAHPNDLKVSAREVDEYCQNSGFRLLQFQKESIYKLSSLSRLDTKPPHKDPFDRILICQALAENMILLTHDTLLNGYSLKNIVVT